MEGPPQFEALIWNLLQSLPPSRSYRGHCPWGRRFNGELHDGLGPMLFVVGHDMEQFQASVIGKKFGRRPWFDLNKTVEGSIAFALSVTACGLILYLAGVVDSFRVRLALVCTVPEPDPPITCHLLRQAWPYGFSATAAACLEGWSLQNDNVVLPMYTWSLLAVLS
jgi:CDP-diglyceride synthetase